MTRAGFLPGAAVGALVAFVAVLLGDPRAAAGFDGQRLSAWIDMNLGHSSWLFAAVLMLFLLHLGRLRRHLQEGRDEHAVVELDQLTDVWTHLFIGIGVIWTAVGMRGALQLTLADPDQALTDSAGTVLGKLVDGGILLALSTTIVGAVGGYLMRLAKTVYAGAALHDFYQTHQQGDLRALREVVERIESRLVTPGAGRASPPAGGQADHAAG